MKQNLSSTPVTSLQPSPLASYLQTNAPLLTGPLAASGLLSTAGSAGSTGQAQPLQYSGEHDLPVSQKPDQVKYYCIHYNLYQHMN